MKPRIKYSRRLRMWLCSGGTVLVIGLTPSDAYRDWERAYVHRRAKLLGNMELIRRRDEARKCGTLFPDNPLAKSREAAISLLDDAQLLPPMRMKNRSELARKALGLIEHDRYLLKVDSRQSGAKGRP